MEKERLELQRNREIEDKRRQEEMEKERLRMEEQQRKEQEEKQRRLEQEEISRRRKGIDWNTEAALEGGQSGQLTPPRIFENSIKELKIELFRWIFGILTPLCVIPSILTPLSDFPNRASV